MTVNAKGETIGVEPKVINTNERIGIAQCMNLAQEALGLSIIENKDEFMSLVREYWKAKQELEMEFSINGGKFKE